MDESTSTSTTGRRADTSLCLRVLYPHVDETVTPLPRGWNPANKESMLAVSHNNLRLHYKGQGKNHKDAAAVRTTHPIPAMCGVYYYEVKILSKGRDGYMGIGVCKLNVMSNRLPGWEADSYGYHGDDGNFFCSTGQGVPYGPTFTTGDVIGCGYNLVDGTIFYTKNGHNLGIATSNIRGELYPTVGLQTPGEAIETNFGQTPFLYDIQRDIHEARKSARAQVKAHPLSREKVEWFDRLVASYLTHQGYCSTAESFAMATQQVSSHEMLSSCLSRQRIRKLVLSGRLSEAVMSINQTYPDLLEKNQALHFLLKCRQFIEMVAGVDADSKSCVRKRSSRSPMQHTVSTTNGMSNGNSSSNGVDHDGLMDCDNGDSCNYNSPEDLRTRRTRNDAHTQRLIAFGKELYAMAKLLTPSNHPCIARLKKQMEEAFSLLAYQDPWACPMSRLLQPSGREPVANALNRAILQELGRPCRAPLELLFDHGEKVRQVMARHNLGTAAFLDHQSLLTLNGIKPRIDSS